MFSAVSVKGERLYLAARRGEAVERPAREIAVTRFDVQRRRSRLIGEGEEEEREEEEEEQESPLCPDVDFLVACSKGTYVRVLAADLGTAAGTAAHLVALRRTRIGAEASVEDAWPLLELVAAVRGEEETDEERREREARESERRRERQEQQQKQQQQQQRTRGF